MVFVAMQWVNQSKGGKTLGELSKTPEVAKHSSHTFHSVNDMEFLIIHQRGNATQPHSVPARISQDCIMSSYYSLWPYIYQATGVSCKRITLSGAVDPGAPICVFFFKQTCYITWKAEAFQFQLLLYVYKFDNLSIN